MSVLVDDLLLLARLDSGRPLAHEEVDLTRLVVDAVNDAKVAGRSHRWVLDAPDTPLVVTGDGPRLHQVVANVLANARLHTPPGTVVTTRLERCGSDARLEIEDDGPGIDPQLTPSVFERFARGDSSRHRAAGSTGLGLSIVRAVIAAHAGKVAIESRPGRTRVAITIPLRSEQDEYGTLAPPRQAASADCEPSHAAPETSR